MRIHYLVIKNFKSYQGKHVIGPFDKFTAIIGENGSGKSNCFDALCFVLGGASNIMRSQKLSNLIWIGSPQAKKAYVKLIFQNDESRFYYNNELIKNIKRKIIGNSSFYYINSYKVSYDEYIKLLNELKFCSKNKSFVLLQGDIQMMAEMKPIQLTKMIEEVSESIKYKDDYEEKEKKYIQIENEVGKIEERREELVHLKKNIKQDVKEAKIWESKKDEMMKEMKICDDFQVMQIVKSIKKYENEKDKINQKFIDIQSEVNDLNDVIESTDNRLKELKASEKNQNKILKTLNSKKEKNKTVIQKLNECKEENQDKLNKLNQLLNILQEKLKKEAQDKSDSESIIEEFKKKNNIIIENRAIFASFKEEIEIIQKRYESYQDIQSIDALKTSLQTNVDLSNNTTEQINYHRELIKNYEERTNEHIEKPEHIADIDALNNELNTIENEIIQKQKELQQFNFMKHLSKKEERQNYMLHYLQQKFKGVHGFVRDICRPVHSKYNLAVTYGIGKFLDMVVVNDISTAKSCIEICKCSNLGYFTFLPMDKLKTKQRTYSLDEKLRNLKELIEYSNEYTVVVEWITNEIYFCESAIDAKRLSKTGKWKNIIDIHGVLYKNNGIIIGGFCKNKKQLYPKNYDELKEKLISAQNRVVEIKEIIREEENNFQKKQKKYNENVFLLDMIHNKKKKCQESISNLLEKLHDYNLNIKNIKDEINLIESNQKEYLRKSCLEIDNYFNQWRDNHNEILMEINCSRFDETINLFNRFIEEEDQVLEVQKKLSCINESTTKQRIHQIKNEKKAFLKQNKEIQISINQNNEDFIKIERDIETAQMKKDEFEKNIHEIVLNKKEFIQKLQKYTKDQYIFESEISSINKRINEAKILLEQFLPKYDNVKDISDLMLMDFSNLPENLLNSKQSKTKHIIYDFNERIKKLEIYLEENTPNFQAVQTFEDLKLKIKNLDDELNSKRYEMNKQHGLFIEIKKKRQQLFNDAYHLIEKSVKEIYPKLTRNPKQPLGGNAFLSPIKPHCMFLDGIIYSVMPPLKRHRALNSLSGGEQTLAVISLLFAMNNVKKSPCFILDEVDSALDKQNLMMLSTFLRMQSLKQQIIIVSHRDVVYSEADTLVGVAHNIKNLSSRIYMLPLKEIINKNIEGYEDTNTESQSGINTNSQFDY